MYETQLSFSSGEFRLTGTLTTASDENSAATVLLISGSGPIDRNSNMKKIKIDVMRQLAAHLAQAGVNSFRYDKRGVGESEGDYKRAGLYDNVTDAAAALSTLRSQPGIDPARLVVVGHSEGALIATELAATDPPIAGVVLLAGPAQSGEDVLRWQAEQIAPTLPAPVKLLLRIFRVDIARTQQKRLTQLKATTGDTTRIQLVKVNARWFREFLVHDPADSLAAITAPVLAITGTKDIQVDHGDVARMRGIVNSEFSGHTPENVTHLLRTDEGPPSVRTYKKQVKRPIDAGVLGTISSWILDHTARLNGVDHETV